MDLRKIDNHGATVYEMIVFPHFVQMNHILDFETDSMNCKCSKISRSCNTKQTLEFRACAEKDDNN